MNTFKQVILYDKKAMSFSYKYTICSHEIRDRRMSTIRLTDWEHIHAAWCKQRQYTFVFALHPSLHSSKGKSKSTNKAKKINTACTKRSDFPSLIICVGSFYLILMTDNSEWVACGISCHLLGVGCHIQAVTHCCCTVRTVMYYRNTAACISAEL